MSGAPATLAYLQSELEAIYGVEAPRVGEFLVGRDGARAAGAAPRAPEALLVVEDGEPSNSVVFACKGDALARAGAGAPRRPRGLERAAAEQLLVAFSQVSHALQQSRGV